MSSAPRSGKTELCPLCGRPADASQRPFCSQGCRDRDLLNWLGDAYRVPGPPAGPDEVGSGGDALDREG